MKLKDYAKVIAKLAAKHPNATVIAASDDEGNSFSEVSFEPSVGNYDGNDFDSKRAPVNAVCVN